MQEKKKIVIAEDHTLLRQALCALLSSLDNIEVVAEAGDGLDAIRCVKTHNPDIILLDLSMPKMNGISVIKEIKNCCPGTKIIVLTMHKREEYILETFKSGADGYCLKSSSHEELIMAIKSVLSGNKYVCPEISDKILEGFIEGKKTIKQDSSWDTLTQREKEVLKLVGEGYKNLEIADYLCISVKTVEKHRANIMQKLNLHTASALTAYSIEKGLVTNE